MTGKHMKPRRITWHGLFFLCVFLAGQSHACPGPMFEYRTFNPTLLPPMESRDVVAKVRILSWEDTKQHNPRWRTYTKGMSNMQYREWVSDSGVYVKVEVLEAIKNVKKGQELTVFVEPYGSCSREPYPPILNREAYIAGAIKNGIFEGPTKYNGE